MRQSPFTAVYDACVLYPAPLRDFLMWPGLSGRFRARWSTQIHEEWKRNLLINRPDLRPDVWRQLFWPLGVNYRGRSGGVDFFVQSFFFRAVGACPDCAERLR